MLHLNQLAVLVPEKRVSITTLQEETQLPSVMLSIYRTIYGLRTVPIWDSSTESLLSAVFEKLLKKMHSVNSVNSVKYLIHVHTAKWLFPFGDHVLSRLKKKWGFDLAMSWGSTQYKCVSFFNTLAILDLLLKNNKNAAAIILTGEVAFTSKLRVVPRSTIVGDAATAALFSTSGEDHALLSVSNKLLSGYAKGIYLSDAALANFDLHFIKEMVEVINQALLKSSISIKEINLILPHNVNIPTWKKIADALRFPIEKVYLKNVSEFGHCFCSDHLINLQSVLSEHLLKKNDYYLMAGCGLGFYLSAAVFRY
ncbi:MAG: hypothetical protein COY58_01355 [Gammaproteobacteria bacterium CG_4_10_14_0_8_um_filter_38_16]|nr:MAG: hypothetical protein COY58_01355 [Gammaproteobacteria bacterium CG_4_10_14_0_8_um_filter_38_16]PJA03503.1 MAG: hypothetical protein COX72_04600 [Gammaproteobacteria bacterium CG_4_10_14_0_2_um_filter_38_22]PJB10269.1 MAG: hypothetical protein CO120_05745 [Gammaproteobacteria bacterium CG_4_9_14_3_um_filter_38_9]